MSNAVLSVDGRKEVNDLNRPFEDGSGSWDVIIPKFKKLPAFIARHYVPVLVIFAVVLVPMIYGYANINVYYQAPIQEFVGQGILDVSKAVSGPGALNARRLEKENISDKYLTNGQKTVMYDVDTNGYDSVWSNDIKEILAGKLSNDSIEKDLRERYNYYNVNWISNNKADFL